VQAKNHSHEHKKQLTKRKRV